MFSAMPKAKGKKGVAARPATVRRSARSVRAPSRLSEEAPPIAPEDEASGDDGGLHRQIAELQAQLRRANTRPDAATARPDAAAARPDAATASTSALDTDVTELPAMSATLAPGAHSPVDPTPMLPPVPTTSQDLLANILHQMTTPTTAGEHDGTAEGGIAQFFVLGATLDPKIKLKIREGAYVDLGSLSAPSDASVSVAMGSDGQPSISLTPSRGRPPTSICEWIRLFGVYASIYVECHPSESAALFTYMVNVMDIHRRHGGVAWRLYDERFRRIRAMAPELPWHLINWDVAMGAIHSAPVDRQAAPQAPVPFRQGAPRSAMRSTPTGVCFDFNYRGTCSRTPCRFKHACITCGQGHPSRTCHTASSRKGRARPPDAGARPSS